MSAFLPHLGTWSQDSPGAPVMCPEGAQGRRPLPGYAHVQTMDSAATETELAHQLLSPLVPGPCTANLPRLCDLRWCVTHSDRWVAVCSHAWEQTGCPWLRNMGVGWGVGCHSERLRDPLLERTRLAGLLQECVCVCVCVCVAARGPRTVLQAHVGGPKQQK